MCCRSLNFGVARARGGFDTALGMDERERMAALIARNRRLVAEAKDLCAQVQEVRLRHEFLQNEMRELRLTWQEIRRQTSRRTPFTLGPRD